MTESSHTAPVIGRTLADSKPWWPTPATRRSGTPNLLIVLFDG